MSDSQPPPPGPPPPPPGPPPPPPPGEHGTYQAYPAPEPPRPRGRARVVLAVVVAVALVGAGAALPLLMGDEEPVAADVDLSAVQTYTTLRTDHVTETVDDYESSPPAGGKHFPIWLDCGVYDEPVRDELAVHDLEHGAFWFAYDADVLSDDDVTTLADKLPDNGIMSPYVGLDAPVVVTVWEAQLALTGVDDPRLDLFLEEYADGVTAPEPFASCAGGASLDDIDELGLPSDLLEG